MRGATKPSFARLPSADLEGEQAALITACLQQRECPNQPNFGPNFGPQNVVCKQEAPRGTGGDGAIGHSEGTPALRAGFSNPETLRALPACVPR